MALVSRLQYISFCHHSFSSADFSTSSSISMRLSLFFVSFLKLLLVAAASQTTSSLSVPCVPLIDYIEPDSQRNLEIFLGGGEIPDDVPIFFDIPSLQISAISPQVKLCIENITMPTSVGGSGELC